MKQQRTGTYNHDRSSVDCDATATIKDLACRHKLIEWKFDPFDVSRGMDDWFTSPLLSTSNIYYGGRISPPIVLFAQLGDLDMLRYILRQSRFPAHEEICRTDECGMFPLYTAISEPHPEGQILTLCRWLYENGADLQQTVGNEWSPLARACLKGYDKVALWLIQTGALLRPLGDGKAIFDTHLAERDLPRFGVYNVGGCDTMMVTRFVHEEIFTWARQTLAARESFVWVLLGTIQRSTINCVEYDTGHGDDRDEVPTQSSLWVLNGHPGLLEHVAGFVGVEVNANILCTARGLVDHHELWWCRTASLEDGSV